MYENEYSVTVKALIGNAKWAPHYRFIRDFDFAILHFFKIRNVFGYFSFPARIMLFGR